MHIFDEKPLLTKTSHFCIAYLIRIVIIQSHAQHRNYSNSSVTKVTLRSGELSRDWNLVSSVKQEHHLAPLSTGRVDHLCFHYLVKLTFSLVHGGAGRVIIRH